MELAAPGPASDFARAQLLLALLVLALLPLFLTTVPAVTHQLRFDFGLIPEPPSPGMAMEHGGWISPSIRPWPSSRVAVRDRYVRRLLPDPSAPRHRLDLLPSGELLLDSRPIGIGALHSRLDRLAATSGWIDFHPHPEARYKDVIDTLAPVAYSGFDRLRLDNSRYSKAFEAAMADHDRPGHPRRSPSSRKARARAGG